MAGFPGMGHAGERWGSTSDCRPEDRCPTTSAGGVMFTVYHPYSDHHRSAQCFDDDLLVCTLTDARLLCTALAEEAPRTKMLAVRQWRGYEGYLLLYIRRLQLEMQRRDLELWFDEDRTSPYATGWILLNKAGLNLAPRPPRWMGGHWFLESQRSNLIRINPTHYAHQFPAARLDMPLLYPQNTPGHFDYTIEVSRSHRDKLDGLEMVIPDEYIEFVAMKGLAW